MLCQKCHKKLGSVRYSEVVDGKVTDMLLCQDCLAKLQEDRQTGFELSTPTAFTGRPVVAGGGVRKRAPKAKERCKACDTDLNSVLETGMVGCVTCYETFSAHTESLLEGIQLALAHRGKVPRLDDARARVRSELQSKRALLKTALSMENYEEAASLRDEIRTLEAGLGASEAGVD